jgi:hypothetical protein
MKPTLRLYSDGWRFKTDYRYAVWGGGVEGAICWVGPYDTAEMAFHDAIMVVPLARAGLTFTNAQ